jgi:hypothetical protein
MRESEAALMQLSSTAQMARNARQRGVGLRATSPSVIKSASDGGKLSAQPAPGPATGMGFTFDSIDPKVFG